MRAMKVKDRKALTEYVRWVADELNLRDWTFHIRHDHIEDDGQALAQVTVTPGRRNASIEFCQQFRELKPEEQREVVIHELLHCHHAAFQHIIQFDLADLLGPLVHQPIFKPAMRSLEYAVDGIANAIAGYFPLIDWPD